MSTKTTPSTLIGNRIITSAANGIKSIKTIFEWEANWPEHWDEAKRHSRSHCLLRIYVDVKANRAVVITSALYSNKSNIGISVDFEGLAKAIAKKFEATLGITLCQVTWIRHYGRFSEPCSFENLTNPDSFYKINLSVVGETKDELEEIYLSSTQAQDLIGWVNLESVEKVLIELDAAHLSKWTRIDVEKAIAEHCSH